MEEHKITLLNDDILRLVPKYAKYQAESKQLLDSLKTACGDQLDKIGTMEGSGRTAAVIELRKRYLENVDTLARIGKGIGSILSYLSPENGIVKTISYNTLFSICSLLYKRNVFAMTEDICRPIEYMFMSNVTFGDSGVSFTGFNPAVALDIRNEYDTTVKAIKLLDDEMFTPDFKNDMFNLISSILHLSAIADGFLPPEKKEDE